jgi:hypothetical protein
MAFGLRAHSGRLLFVAISGIFMFFLGLFLVTQNSTDLGSSGDNSPLISSSGSSASSEPEITDSSQIPSPAESAQSEDQQAQLESEIAQLQEENIAQEMSQQGQIPVRFACDVDGFRTGEGRSLLRLSVSAPDSVPEVWVTVKTERGVVKGSVLLENGSGQQTVPLRNPTQAFRPEVKVYSLPIFTEQYEMCSFR